MKKSNDINYSLEDLKKLSQTPVLFLQMVQANKWHRLLYNNDHTRNDKIRFVRQWYFEKTGQRQ